jgi:CubicO group peptidase (beta-lactamase class C family)
MKRICLYLIIVILISACNDNDEVVDPGFVNLEEEVGYLADQYVKVGAMVGIIDKKQNRHIFSFGSKSLNNAEPPDVNTVFDIGSITKSFTAILTAKTYLEMDTADEIVGHYLPADKVTMPVKDSVEINFLHLLTHTSGLPRTPHVTGSDFPLPDGYDGENPYSAYTTEDVYNYLSNYCELEFTPGTYWGYSNTGYGLLGHTLGLIDGTSYEHILSRDIFNTLGMDNSSLFLTDEQLLNMAPGHDHTLMVVPNYTANDIFQGCGMIKSSLNDLFKYLESNMGLVESPLKDAMSMTHMNSGIYTGSMGYIGLAWYIIELEDGQEIIYTGGDTNGHSTYLAFNKSNLTGVIILLNASLHDGTNLNFGQKLMMAINKY